MKFIHFPHKSLFLLAGDIGIITISYLLSLLIWFGPSNQFSSIALISGFSFLIVSLFIFYLLDSYNIEFVSQRVKYLFRHMTALVITAGLLSLYFFFQPDLKSGRGVFVICLVLAGAGTYYWRVAFLSLVKKSLMSPKRLIIIGSGSAGETLYHAIKDNSDYQVLGRMNDGSVLPPSSPIAEISGGPTALKKMIKDREADILVLTDSHFKDRALLKTALDCKLNGIRVYDMPSFYEIVTGKVPVEQAGDSWLVFPPLIGGKKRYIQHEIEKTYRYHVVLCRSGNQPAPCPGHRRRGQA